MLRQERFSAYSHGLMAILSLIGGIIVIAIASYNPVYQFISGLACATGVFCMGASALYHSKKLSENENNWRRKLDHIAIFFIIAGFFSTLTFFYLPAPWKWILIGLLWIFVVAGFFLKLFFLNAPRWLSPIIYIGMSLIAVIPLPTYMGSMSSTSLILLIVGGTFDIIGGIIYGRKRPDPKPGVFGFHDIFHICIAIGITLFYFIIVDMVLLFAP
jgi:hemolysin III